MNESPSSMADLLLLWWAVLPQRKIPFHVHIAVPAPYRTMRVQSPNFQTFKEPRNQFRQPTYLAGTTTLLLLGS